MPEVAPVTRASLLMGWVFLSVPRLRRPGGVVQPGVLAAVLGGYGSGLVVAQLVVPDGIALPVEEPGQEPVGGPMAGRLRGVECRRGTGQDGGEGVLLVDRGDGDDPPYPVRIPAGPVL
jgi:hypothetical protein